MKINNKKIASVLVFMMMVCTLMLSACSTQNNPNKIVFLVEDRVYFSIETNGLETVNLPHNPVRSGYTFDGWYIDNNEWTELFTEDYFLEKNLEKNIVIYSKWNLETYTINYKNLNGANNPNPATYTIESEDIILLDLSFEGQTFLGWYVGNDKVDKITKGSAGDFELTAKWA